MFWFNSGRSFFQKTGGIRKKIGLISVAKLGETVDYRSLILSPIKSSFFSQLALFALLVVVLGGVSVLTFQKYLVKNHNAKVLSAQSENKGEVLASTTQALKGFLSVNVPTNLNDNVFIKKDLEVAGSANFKGAVIVDGQTLDANTLTGANSLQALTAGSGITVGTGQNPTITNSGVVSLQGKNGTLTFEAGSGISIDGMKISSSVSTPNTFKTVTVGADSFSAGSSTDTLTLAAGDGLTLTTDTTNKKITFAAGAASGWTVTGTNVNLTTITNKVGIGTTSPSTTLDITGTLNTTGAVTFGSTLAVTGNTSITGTTSLGSNLSVTGAATVSGNLNVAGIASVSGSEVIAPSTAGTTALTLRASPGSTGNIFDIQNYAGTTSLLTVSNDGSLTMGGSTLNGPGIESTGAIHLTSAANSIVGTAIKGGWTMNSNTFTYRRPITVTNTSGTTLPKNYQITIALSSTNSNQVYTNTQTGSPYYDFRAAWDNSGSVTEIARNVSSYTSSNITYSFQLQSNIAASGSDTYYIYYSNSALATIPAAYSSYTGNVQIENADSITNWASGDSTNYPLALETTIKNEGTGSIKATGGLGTLGTLSTTSQGQLATATKKATALTGSIGGTNYIYTIGGNTGSSDVTTVTKTTIDGSGNAGTPTTTSQGQLSTGISGHASFSLVPSVSGGTGVDGTLDLSLGSSTGGCNGTGLSWNAGSSTCTIDTTIKSTFNFTSVNISAGTTLTVSGGAFLTINATGNVTVAGTISLNGKGYAQRSGPGVGTTPPSCGTYVTCGGGGGGNGGAGGAGGGGYAGGGTYSTEDMGSGGGGGGGAGGGGIKIASSGTISNSGTISANGGTPADSGGGGSGGYIKLNGNTVINTGTISANGSNGGSGGIGVDSYGHATRWYGGGGGGGGRIIFAGNSITQGTTTVTLGSGGPDGGTGVAGSAGSNGSVSTTSNNLAAYALGGINGTTRQTGVYKSTITGSDLGAFSTASQGQLPVALTNLTSNTVSISGTDYLYLLGGNSASGDVNTVYKATIDGSGNIGAFSTTSQGQLPQTLSKHSSIISTISSTNYIHVLGGLNGSTAQNTVYKATIDGSGNIGAFSAVSQTALPAAIYDASVFKATVGSTNYIYLVGGLNSAGNPVNTIYKGTLDGSGNVTGWVQAGTVPTTLSGTTSVAATTGASSYVYVIGGNNSTPVATVYRGLINDMSGYTATRTLASAVDLSNKNSIQVDYYSNLTGRYMYFEISQDNLTWTQCANNTDFTSGQFIVNSVNTWETKTCDISAVANASKNAILYLRLRVGTSQSSAITSYFDNIYAYMNIGTVTNTTVAGSAVMGASNLNVNAQGTGGVQINYDSASGLAGSGGMRVYDGGIGLIYSITSTGTASASGGLTFTGASSSAQLNMLNGQNLTFKTSVGGDAGLATRLTLLNSGQFGIGSGTPVGLLDVNGAVTGKALAIFNETGGQNILTASGSGTTRLVLTNAGKLGLGNTSPVGLLDVLSNLGTVSVASFSGSTSFASLVVNNNSTTGDLFTASASGLSRFVIKNNGQVMIGTTSATKLFEINKYGTAGDGIAINGTNDTRIQIGLGQPSFWSWANGWQTPGDFSLIEEGVSGSRIYVKPGGKIGIGTTSPLAAFDVSGIGTTPVASFSGSTSFASLVVNNNLTTGDLFTASASGLTRFTIANNGNITAGGTISGLSGLTSSGTITLSGFSSNGGVLFANGSGVLSQTGAGNSTQCLLGGTTPSFGSCSNVWQILNGAIVPQNITTDLLIGGNSTTSALFRVTGNGGLAGTSPVASVSGNTSFAAFVVDNKGAGDLFTASSSGLTRLTLTNAGNLGVGTASPSSLLQVGTQGDGTVAKANAWNVFSDLRFKENINPLQDALSKVMSLVGVSFNWRNSGNPSIGFIAQDVEKIVPEIVTTDSNGFKSLDYGKITPLLVNAIHQQQEQMASLSAKMDKLETINFLPFSSIATDSSMITIKDSLLVLGSTTTNDLSVGNSLTIGNTMQIGTNSINTVGQDLEIQPLKQGAISMMGGLVKIETDGTLKVAENAEFAKDVKVGGVLSATSIQIPNQNIVDLSDTESTTSGSAGISYIKAGQTLRKINTGYAKPNSVILITPNSAPVGQQPYILEKNNGNFIVGIESSLLSNFEFNFLIINKGN